MPWCRHYFYGRGLRIYGKIYRTKQPLVCAIDERKGDYCVLLDFNDERLTPRQKRRLRSGAASWAIEDMPLTARNRDRMVRLTLGLMTPEEAVAEIDAEIR